ncbi:hypothetical protein SO802_003068 [Lithocarpus litseifolius]|uniref:RNase H type-1 domain-containing protein n=1 Tax=Lithocarpus litseifolius TaxID=425828 RepID=A0AAW2E2T1_9ROSI
MSYELSHVKRDANMAAHRLARHACNVYEPSVWLEEAASFLSASLQNDALLPNALLQETLSSCLPPLAFRTQESLAIGAVHEP